MATMVDSGNSNDPVISPTNTSTKLQSAQIKTFANDNATTSLPVQGAKHKSPKDIASEASPQSAKSTAKSKEEVESVRQTIVDESESASASSQSLSSHSAQITPGAHANDLTPEYINTDPDAEDESANHDQLTRTPTHKLSSSTLSPSPVSDNASSLDLGASTTPSASSVSGQSISSVQSEAEFRIKKRGYMRPQATNFSESAKGRESVQNLGSIAHLQYYFARTGLLDGKGGQLARRTSQNKAIGSSNRSISLNVPNTASGDGIHLPSPTSDCGSISQSPDNDAEWDRELAMLPPTVSTYNQKPAYVQPPPDLTMLRRELTESLEEALKVLKDSDMTAQEEDSQGWYEIQGLHLLDIITLAIRAAKNYYTAHSQYQRLHAIKSERTIRRELYQVLDILKRMATRNFAGGLRQNEKVEILTWIVGISELIQTEIDQEKKEAEERERWAWRTGDWTGKEREREHAFIKCFINSQEALPEWTTIPTMTSSADTSVQPTPFLQFFQDGLQLVHLHNALVRKSQRSFEVIEKFHTDTNKPYRCAENLRFWIKAAELRWDIHLKVDVMGVVQSLSAEALRQFDEAILQWCTGVREEFTQELSEAKDGYNRRTPPRLKVERADSALSMSSPTSASSPMSVKASQDL